MIHNDRTLLWETSGNIYNTTFNLSEPVTHYESIEVYASGKENDAGGIHLSKQTFNTQNAKMACDCFGYSPWTTGYNYVLGSDFTISGTQCYCGSSYYMGMALNSTAYAAGKWVDANAQKMLQPIKIIGINRKPTLHLHIINGDHGTVSASVLTGCEYDTVTLSNTPDEDWYFSGYNITGATLTGNKFTFGNSDVTVEGGWTQDAFPITYQNDGHGTVTGPATAVPNSNVTLTSNYNTYYRLSGYQVTGGTINGNTLTVTGPCTAKAVFKPNTFTAAGKFETATSSHNAAKYSKTLYAYQTAHQANVPASWYSTSNRWNPSNASAYKIELKPSLSSDCAQRNATLYTDFRTTVGGTNYATVHVYNSRNNEGSKSYPSTGICRRYHYNPTVTSNNQGLSYQYVSAGGNGSTTYIDLYYYAGSWTASGYAP